MNNIKIKIKLNSGTIIGKTVDYLDRIYVSEKIIALSLLIFVFSFIVVQQNSKWSIFPRSEAAALDNSGLPIFSLEKKTIYGVSMHCKNDMVKNDFSKELSFKQFVFKKNAEKIISDKPMKEMLDAVAQRDNETASYLVAIAKKESNLGKFSPKDENGKNCYNYWGYRGRQNTTKSGYSCFDSPEQAVEVVGNRIQALSQAGKFDTPKKMAVWKCGYDCSWDNPASVQKWIADVELYYKKLNL